MNESQNTPELRFEGFTEPWKRQKLGDIAEVTMGQSPNGSCYTDNPEDPILVQGNADLRDGWVFPRVWTTQVTKTARAGDLIMSVRAPVGAIGKTAYDVVLGRGVCGIKGNEFLFQFLSKLELEKYWFSVSTGSTFDSINGDELRATPIFMPTSIQEQEAIGSLLSRLDSFITLYQRKYERLQHLKQALLRKMFPKPGEQVPELRFEGFTEPWEQRKLGEVVDVYDGVHQTPDYTDKGIMFLSVENISTLKSEKYISEEAFNRDYKVYPEKGDILMTRIGDVGTPNVVETTEKVAFYVSLALLKPTTNVDSYFLCNSILSPFFQNELKERTLVTAIPQKINKDEIGKVSLYLPNLIDEQKKIGAFFRHLNTLITLHRSKCERLRRLKQALLQKMFV